MKKLPPLGSADWIAAVFSAAPVINTRGQSKHTQHHQAFDHVAGRFIGAQGRLEHCSASLLKLMRTLGLVRRFKEQPFQTDEEEFGARIVPDFLLETTTDQPIVLENKTARFVTREVEMRLEAIRKRFADAGLRYLVWTDQSPLNHATRHNLALMAQAASSAITQEEVNESIRYVDAQQFARQHTVRTWRRASPAAPGCTQAIAPAPCQPTR